MAIILIRADNQNKLLNAIADIERHANLKIAGKPKIIGVNVADKIAKGILRQELRTKSKIAALVRVLEDSTKSIMQIKKIHPPAHLLVISNEYKEYGQIKETFGKLPPLKGYYSHKHFK